MDIRNHPSFRELEKQLNQYTDYDVITIRGIPNEYIYLINDDFSDFSYFYTTLYSKSVKKYLKSIDSYQIDQIAYPAVVRTLDNKNFERVDRVSERKEYSIKGDIIIYWPTFSEYPIKIEFFGDDIETAEMFDVTINKSTNTLSTLLFPNESILEEKNYPIYLRNPEKKQKEIVVNFDQFSASGIDFDFKQPPLFFSRKDLLKQYIERYEEKSFKIIISTKHPGQIDDDLNRFISSQDYPSGIISNELKTLILTDREIFGSIFLRNEVGKNNRSSQSRKLLSQFEGEIEVGDYVVHEDHGVGIYSGIIQEKISLGNEYESNFIKIEYKGGDELLVPLDKVEKITKYFGSSDTPPEVTRLGKSDWSKTTDKVKASIKLMAGELVRHYAKISLSHADKISEGDSEEYKRFVSKFEYEETPDQQRSIHEVINDLEKEQPMNRLLVGDVGFGKTEVILRAAFKVVESGKQVAILAPTTVLVKQHQKVFRDRFKGFDYKISTLSRLNDKYENKDIIETIKNNNVDIIIGTHRLLSNDIEFKNLGLIVIDEEQKFGVKQKEKLKKLKYGVHVLSTSATPIPRTLSMALSSIQDISIIQTAPKGRKPVKTHVEKLDWNKIVNAINKERERGGQIFFIYNKVSDINSIARKINSFLPDLKVAIGHGQMSGSKLDKIMSQFIDRKYDLLLSTTIIENGIDLSNVNTLIVIKSQNFGLSQLYQLRGRVGRSEREAHAYFFYDGIDLSKAKNKDLSEEEKKLVEKNYLKRLMALKQANELGAGFDLATKDLEIRGAGNILGSQQHGNISKIGYGLYMQMLSNEIERIKNSN